MRCWTTACSQQPQISTLSPRNGALFRDLPDAIANTVELSNRLRFELSDLGYEFPRYPVPDGETMDSFLRKRVADGVIRRYGPKNDFDLLRKTKKSVAIRSRYFAGLSMQFSLNLLRRCNLRIVYKQPWA